MGGDIVIQLPASFHRSLAEIVAPLEIAVDNYEGSLSPEQMMCMSLESISKRLLSVKKFKNAVVTLQEKLCNDVKVSADESSVVLLAMGKGIPAAREEFHQNKKKSLQAINDAFSEMVKKISAVIDKVEKRLNKST